MEKKSMTIMHAQDMQKTTIVARTMSIVAKVFTYLFLFIMALTVLFPFYWMIISSLKTEQEYMKPIPTFIPQTVEMNQYFLINNDMETGSVEKLDVRPESGNDGKHTFDTALHTLVFDFNDQNSYYLGITAGETKFSATNTQDITGENAGNLGVKRFPARLYEFYSGSVSEAYVTKRPRPLKTYLMGAQMTDGSILYFNGKFEAVDGSYQLGTTKDPQEAAVVGVENAGAVTSKEDGKTKIYYVYLSYMEGENTRYIRTYHQDTGYIKYSIPRNYVDAFTTADLGKLFMNTLYVGIVSTLLSLVITVLSAFAFARLEFKGKDALFGALLATMMIPGELFTITNYITVVDFGWLDKFEALIIPFLVSVFYIYLLRQNFMQIPNELYLAAKVDGTSDLKYLWKVMVPLALPTLISITILKMMGAWNSYIWPKLVADENAQLITNGLRNAFTSDATGQANIPVQMAAVAIVSAPLFMVFLFLRKYIMAGVSRSGIKG